jgi:predicted transcriptional regulator
MSVAESLDELPRLSADERHTILRRLVELDAELEIEETQAMISKIEAGMRSMESDSGVSLDEARGRMAGWISK